MFISYISRTANDILADLRNVALTIFNTTTDLSDDTFQGKVLRIFSGLAEYLNYYIDNSAREAFVSECRLFKSIVLHSYANDVVLYSLKPSAVTVELTYTKAGNSVTTFPATTIPSGSVFKAASGRLYVSTAVVVLPEINPFLNAYIKASVPCVNEVAVDYQTLGTGDNTENQTFILDNTKKVSLNKVYVSDSLGNSWQQVETFAFSTASDRHFKVTLDIDSRTIIIFGDGLQAMKPSTGLILYYAYISTDGENDLAGTITSLNTAGSLVAPTGFILTINNPQASTGGGQADNLDTARKRILSAQRTNKVMVRPSDFKDRALEHSMVYRAKAVGDGGFKVTLYIYPYSGGLASYAILTTVKNFLDQYKSINTKIFCLPCSEVFLTIEAVLYVNSGFSAVGASNAAVTALENLTVEKNIETYLSVSNLYQAIENVQGVTDSGITAISYRQTPQPQQELSPSLLVDYSYTGEINKEVKVQFTTATEYVLTIGGDVVGTYATGASNTFDALSSFVITSNGYSAGQIYLFTVFNRTNFEQYRIPINSVGVPIIDGANISITTVGGF